MATIIKALYGPILHPVDAANFTDEDGDVYRLHGDPKFKKKLGKKVLILDIDSRPLTGPGQLMNTELKWKGMRPLSAGMLSHYMFGTFELRWNDIMERRGLRGISRLLLRLESWHFRHAEHALYDTTDI
jgi:hypothetical protein